MAIIMLRVYFSTTKCTSILLFTFLACLLSTHTPPHTHTHTHFPVIELQRDGTIIPILQMRKLKPGEVNGLPLPHG